MSWVQNVQAVQAVQDVWNDLNYLNGSNSAEHQAVHAGMTDSSVIVASQAGIQLAYERSSLQIDQRLFDLLLRVHDERAVPRNRFFQWLAGNQ